MPREIEKLEKVFSPSNKDIRSISISFHHAMLCGLNGQPSSLKMLPSFLTMPDGNEQGLYMALDFGGTNVRVLLVELHGNGRYTILARRQARLKDSNGLYDFTSPNASANELFDFIAKEVAQLAPSGKELPLGHTFSFPSNQLDVNSALLINWTKEIAVSGVEGNDVTKLLTAALQRAGLVHIRPAAIINDTVGTLLTSSYSHPDSHLGSICGTGHNTAYLERCYRAANNAMIINMESGNFNCLPLTKYDRLIDAASEKPGGQLLEKAVSGRYLGELLRLILLDILTNSRLDCLPSDLQNPYSLSAEDIALILADTTTELDNIAGWLVDHCRNRTTSIDDRLAVKKAAGLLVSRSAYFVAASYLGVIQHIDPNFDCSHHIAIDGSLFEKMPGYAQAISKAITEVHGGKAGRITTSLIKDGSGVGAAIAAAIACKKKL